jgi:hypothetical protein
MLSEFINYILTDMFSDFMVNKENWHKNAARDKRLAELQGKATYIRSKVVGPFPGSCASGSCVGCPLTLRWSIRKKNEHDDH